MHSSSKIDDDNSMICKLVQARLEAQVKKTGPNRLTVSKGFSHAQLCNRESVSFAKAGTLSL
jgi:hypothetical protein